jgi:uncharacterized surface protein with fasciclin (FAS1) repeats
MQFHSNKEWLMIKSLYTTVTGILLAFAAAFSMAADLIETASTSGETKTFAKAIETAGIRDSLKHNGPYTIFAPDDAAFAKLPPETRNALMKDKARLAKVLAHHVIPGKVLVAEVKPGKVKTLGGDEVMLRSDNGKVTVDDANVTLSDVTADNGVIHVIDTVILPAQ